MAMSSAEYVLTNSMPSTELQLKARLRTMPQVDMTTTKSVLTNLTKDCIRAPCIIHSCADTQTGRNYEVSFLQKNADLSPMDRYDRIWISENEMFKYASHSLVVKKHVFDETIMMRNQAPRTLVPADVHQGDFGLPSISQL